MLTRLQILLYKVLPAFLEEASLQKGPGADNLNVYVTKSD